MNNELIIAVIAIISGGALTGVINALYERSKGKTEMKGKDIDDRIRAWQQISDKNEARIAQLERKLEALEKDIYSLDRYILALEKIISRAELELPPRPILERERFSRDAPPAA